MSIALSGTFDYVVAVPENPRTFPWQARLREPIRRVGKKVLDQRLAGHSPRLTMVDQGPPPNPGWDQGKWRPKAERCQLTLEPTEWRGGHEASFFVAKRWADALESGDQLHLSLAGCGGLGASVIRDGRLMSAAGAIFAVPLGSELRIARPTDAFREAEAVLQRLDPKFRFHETPILVESEGGRRLLYRGQLVTEAIDIHINHGRLDGIPGTDECVAISAQGEFPQMATLDTVSFLEADGLTVAS